MSGDIDVLAARLQLLADRWGDEGSFLNNPYDDPVDRACGQMLQQCASELIGVVDGYTRTPNKEGQIMRAWAEATMFVGLFFILAQCSCKCMY